MVGGGEGGSPESSEIRSSSEALKSGWLLKKGGGTGNFGR